ncbi:MAG: hydrogenase maturation nickel metallochaperone HypA [Deltaproteobacteria bacterium]|nr:hydrogenase maturation nickel metallochaperone HypA [Deltaproteobacteria bacterium]
MHELSLAQSLVEQLLVLAAEQRATRVVRIRVRIEPLAGVVTDSFSFGFEAVKTISAVTRDAILELDCPPASYRCLACGRLSEHPLPPEIPCPGCGAKNRQLPTGGDQLLLLQVELEEQETDNGKTEPQPREVNSHV